MVKLQQKTLVKQLNSPKALGNDALQSRSRWSTLFQVPLYLPEVSVELIQINHLELSSLLKLDSNTSKLCSVASSKPLFSVNLLQTFRQNQQKFLQNFILLFNVSQHTISNGHQHLASKFLPKVSQNPWLPSSHSPLHTLLPPACGNKNNF
jgi:hypothetical protein